MITVTNNIYMTKTDTVTKTITNTQNIETPSEIETDTLEDLYKSMNQNRAVFYAILNGTGTSDNPGLSTVLTQLSGGTKQLKEGIDTMILGVNNLKQSICGNQENYLASQTH